MINKYFDEFYFWVVFSFEKCMYAAPAHYVVAKYGAHGRLDTFYALKLFQILRRTLKLWLVMSSCYYSMEVVIVRTVVISESKSDKCDLWDQQYVGIQGQCSCHGWWMLMQKVKKEMTTTPLHTSSQTWRGSAHWNSVTQGGNDNFCVFIINCKLESEKF